MILSILVVSMLVCTASAAGQSSHLRSLTQFAKEAAFPYCRCNDYSPDSSPYSLIPTNSSGIDANNVAYGEFCFTVQYWGANSEASPCYKSLEKSLDKMIFAIQPACVPAFDTTGRYITVNGKKKSSSYRTKDYPLGSTLELFNLKLSSASEGTEVCFRAAAPCDIPENMFDASPISYALVESSNHKCCPLPNFVKPGPGNA